MLKTWRANRQPQDQAGHYTRNELSVRPLSIEVKQHNIIEVNAEGGALGHTQYCHDI